MRRIENPHRRMSDHNPFMNFLNPFNMLFYDQNDEKVVYFNLNFNKTHQEKHVLKKHTLRSSYKVMSSEWKALFGECLRVIVCR